MRALVYYILLSVSFVILKFCFKLVIFSTANSTTAIVVAYALAFHSALALVLPLLCLSLFQEDRMSA